MAKREKRVKPGAKVAIADALQWQTNAQVN
jgi:hypothetical protein